MQDEEFVSWVLVGFTVVGVIATLSIFASTLGVL